MDIKESILKKIFDGEELSSEEQVYVAKLLTQSTETSTTIPYHHDVQDCFAAIGVTMADIDKLNAVLEKVLAVKTSSLSEEIEVAESMVPPTQVNFRLLLLQNFRNGMRRKQFEI